MASVKETTEESSENPDLAAVQQLLFSVGRLKFSMRSLSSMHVQTALHSQKETECPSRFSPLESNTVLENMINEVLSNKPDPNENTDACKTDEAQKSVSVEDLELVQKKLQEEFERRRHRFVTTFSNRLQKQ